MILWSLIPRSLLVALVGEGGRAIITQTIIPPNDAAPTGDQESTVIGADGVTVVVRMTTTPKTTIAGQGETVLGAAVTVTTEDALTVEELVHIVNGLAPGTLAHLLDPLERRRLTLTRLIPSDITSSVLVPPAPMQRRLRPPRLHPLLPPRLNPLRRPRIRTVFNRSMPLLSFLSLLVRRMAALQMSWLPVRAITLSSML